MTATEVTIKATRTSLVEIVKAEPKRYSEAELGTVLGVSRQRIYDLVKRLGLGDLVRPKQWSFHCLDCGKPIHSGVIRCWQCWMKIWGARGWPLLATFVASNLKGRNLTLKGTNIISAARVAGVIMLEIMALVLAKQEK